MKIVKALDAWLYRRDRRRFARHIRQIQSTKNRGNLKYLVLNLPGIRGWTVTTGGGVEAHVVLKARYGYEFASFDWDLRQALRNAAARYIWWELKG